MITRRNLLIVPFLTGLVSLFKTRTTTAQVPRDNPGPFGKVYVSINFESFVPDNNDLLATFAINQASEATFKIAFGDHLRKLINVLYFKDLLSFVRFDVWCEGESAQEARMVYWGDQFDATTRSYKPFTVREFGDMAHKYGLDNKVIDAIKGKTIIFRPRDFE